MPPAPTGTRVCDAFSGTNKAITAVLDTAGKAPGRMPPSVSFVLNRLHLTCYVAYTGASGLHGGINNNKNNGVHAWSVGREARGLSLMPGRIMVVFLCK